jgi:antitoxin ParD1/3/4
MPMAALNISLPKTMKDFVEAEVRVGGFSTPSEYMRALVRAEQKRRAEERLEALLLEGVNSGNPLEVGPEYWARKKRELTAHRGRKKKPSG